MKVNGIKCKKCNSIIYSRCTHDFHWCPCENVAIDGGQDYMKISFHEAGSYETVEVEVNASQKELYEDWSKEKDKFGTILEKK